MLLQICESIILYITYNFHEKDRNQSGLTEIQLIYYIMKTFLQPKALY